MLTRSHAREDLARLGREIARRYSYFALRERPFLDALADATATLDDVADGQALGRAVMRVLASLADGHTRLKGAPDAFLPRAFSSCLFAPVAGGVVAFRVDRSGFVDDRRPFVAAIDGVEVESWLQALSPFVAADTTAVGRRRAARLLRFIGFARSLLGLPVDGPLHLALGDAPGMAAHTVTLPLAEQKPLHGTPPDVSRLVPPDIGYLRLDRCDEGEAAEQSVHAAMRAVLGARAFVLDLRDNGGGSRQVIRTLLPYLMATDEPPAVVAAAFYRLQPRDLPDAPDGYLADRYMYPRESSVWTSAERAAADAFARGFSPRWTPPADQGFSALHVMAVSRPPDAPVFGGPVVVLVDEGSYSATEILLAALKRRPRVTLVGAPSGGGSGRPRGFGLPLSGLRVHHSTMVSYASDGAPIQGAGISPDHRVEPAAADLLGRTDHALAHAVALLR